MLPNFLGEVPIHRVPACQRKPLSYLLRINFVTQSGSSHVAPCDCILPRYLVSGFILNVKEAFGQLKRQFHALQSGLRYGPKRSSRLIATAICLRNAAIFLREPPPYEDEGIVWDNEAGENAEDLRSGNEVINSIVENYFT
ncbi:unnamed protein product [Cylicocyclus nassatus]|uniref:DDE Tnp4 domain-containing protein n=1 Tax=Cylicocyclus nassatus TaxID=53992 RepID=A0AA36MA30_CYLNA|nr:unnamed protein product [Cylicocyclus nassatus]